MRRAALPTRMDRRTFLGAAASLPWLATPRRGQGTTLRVSATPSTFRPMFETLRREFERLHPGVQVTLNASARDQEQQIQNTLRRALIENLPDVSFEGLRHLRILQRRRIAVPLDALIANDPEWNASASNPMIESARTGGSLVGLGAALSVPIIYYNADAVSALIGTHDLPSDWDQLLLLLVQFGRKARPGALGGFIQHASTSWNFLALVESFGGSMMDPSEREITFDAAPGRRALQIHAAFGRAGQARMDMNREQARQAFAAGSIAILVDSSSSLATLESQIGGRFQLRTTSIPLGPGGRIPVSGIAAVLMARESAQQALAWKFIKFVCGPLGQTIIGKSTGYMPANDAVVSEPERLGRYYQERPLVHPIVSSLRFASQWYAFPGDNSAKIDAVISNNVSAVVGLSKTPDQALATMRRSVQALLPERRP